MRAREALLRQAEARLARTNRTKVLAEQRYVRQVRRTHNLLVATGSILDGL